ncbi:MAG: ribonuclease E inhibitor RraB [Anderseniella sp.]
MKLPNDAIGDALQRLVDDGSDLSQPMAMDFFPAVPDRGAAETIEPDVQKLGFETSISEEEGEWTLYCTKTIIPSYDNVASIESTLHRVAQRVGGHADGFGSFGNAPP